METGLLYDYTEHRSCCSRLIRKWLMLIAGCWLLVGGLFVMVHGPSWNIDHHGSWFMVHDHYGCHCRKKNLLHLSGDQSTFKGALYKRGLGSSLSRDLKLKNKNYAQNARSYLCTSTAKEMYNKKSSNQCKCCFEQCLCQRRSDKTGLFFCRIGLAK
jgi:hypothetical protein